MEKIDRSGSSHPRPAIVSQFPDDPELFDMLNEYRMSLGWTWKRIILIGMADIIANNGDNPDLVVRIADYLMKGRKGRE